MEKKCIHNKCVNHDTEWENVGDVKILPFSTFFGLKKTYWTKSCCCRWMQKIKEVQTRRCKKCGRIEEYIINSRQMRCNCCGTIKELPYFAC